MAELTWKQDAESLGKSQTLSARDGRWPEADAPRIPGYAVSEKIGEGQYGAVWKALDLNSRIPVAIKMFHHSGGLDYALLHGEVEKLIALCEDQHIVGLREVGWDADPPYFVMDYLENSLEKRLRSGPLPVDEAVEVFERIVTGMVHAHNKGILHCDLKPGNILLDHENQPRIADFGQSRLSNQQTPALGTLFYMAPEQADLKGVPDARWDVYSAGAVLYCMLTGAAPYQTEASRKVLSEAGTAPAVLARYREIIENSPKPMDHARVPGTDRSLIEVIDRCLEKEPRRRYPNAQAIREAIQRRARWHKQKPILALGIALPLVFLLLMASAFWYQISRARDTAITNLVDAAKASNLSFATAVNGSVARQFDRRWRSLSRLAEKREFVDTLRIWREEAANYPAGQAESPEMQKAAVAIQQAATRYLKDENQGTYAIACIVLDRDGNVAAFAPDPAAYYRKNLKNRDYFRGIINEDTVENVHVSRAFHPLGAEGQEENHHVLVFSVPVREVLDDASDPSSRAEGVLCMAVPVGDFREIQYSNLETIEAKQKLKGNGEDVKKWIPQFASLIDTRPTEAPRHEVASHANSVENPEELGLVLQHAYYKVHSQDQYGDKYQDFPQRALPQTAAKLLGAVVDEATRVYERYKPLFEQAQKGPNPQDAKRILTDRRGEDLAKLYSEKEMELAAHFTDPFGALDPRFAADKTGGWILSARPIFVQRPGNLVPKNTGLVVVAQQRMDVVSRPAFDMTGGMQKTSSVIFVIAGALMLVVWFYGFTLLNPASQSRLSRAIWRIAGLRTARSSSAFGRDSGLSSRSGAPGKTPAAH